MKTFALLRVMLSNLSSSVCETYTSLDGYLDLAIDLTTSKGVFGFRCSVKDIWTALLASWSAVSFSLMPQ